MRREDCEITTIEWRRSREKHVTNYSKRPDITSVVIITRQHLRGGVITRAHSLTHALIEIEVLAQTKINHDEWRSGRVAFEEEVFKFQIAMDNPFPMKIVNAGEHVAHETGRTIFTKHKALIFSRSQQLIELSTPTEELSLLAERKENLPTQVSHQVDRSSTKEDILKLDDIRVVNLTKNLNFRVKFPKC